MCCQLLLTLAGIMPYCIFYGLVDELIELFSPVTRVVQLFGSS